MPHLDANALETDPEGGAFLRDVIGKPTATVEPSWSTVPKRAVVQAKSITHRHRAALAAVGVGFRLLAFLLVVAAIARSRVQTPG
jgi:hypothetical protein